MHSHSNDSFYVLRVTYLMREDLQCYFSWGYYRFGVAGLVNVVAFHSSIFLLKLICCNN